MILFNYETDFQLNNATKVGSWISKCIIDNGFKEGELNFIFCSDAYLHKLNVDFLKHDTLTDIISFDYCLGKELNGDIFISVERVRENALKYSQTFDNELNRVVIHGVLHFMGFKDKSDKDKDQMRLKENECLELYNK